MKKNSINTFGNRELSIEVLYDVVFQGTSKLTHLEDLDFPLYLIKADFLGLFNLEFW